ncbi:nicotinate phosphoribosyltransferase [Ensifer soli]|uniref:nicotinate phosphoribosyltransferase n=1 Tax=Ciceribacter sp. sgz301302 TaxID=3342379 RepID=UPI0035BAF088
MPFSNPILDTDSYKLGHFLQYPPKTAAISAYVEARGPTDQVDVVFFGLQMYLKSSLARRVTAADVEEAAAIAAAHGQPFHHAGWMHIVERHGGVLPLLVEALPEGTRVRRGVPLVQVVNTDPACFWLTSHVETALIRAIWYPSTVASLSRRILEQIRPAVALTCDDPDGVVRAAIHDFGARGATCREQAGLGGAAHLLHFDRTDTLTGLLHARRFYGADMAGHSFPASEHGTMTAWGGTREAEAYANMVDRFGAGTYSVVSDSYDINTAVSEIWGRQLKARVQAAGGRLIIRPDSGDPIETPVQVVQQLDYRFGSTPNRKGYKVLHPSVRVLQGDGISINDIGKVLARLEAFGFSAENISFGMGSAILQKMNRDSFSFAMKVNARQDTDGTWHDVFKRPGTMNLKASKAGRQAVVETINGPEALRLDQLGAQRNLLEPVWRDGVLLKDWRFDEIRARLA